MTVNSTQPSTRPVYHFTPKSNWMNDPNGTLLHDGWYHLFYQYNPSGDQWGNIHWAHARSRNLVDWERLPIALAPSAALGEEHCYSGCCVLDKNRVPRIFYTKVGGATEQWTAEGSNDLTVWTKGPCNPLLSRKMPGLADFDEGWRDPFVFQYQGKHFMILGAEVNNRSVIPLFEATDDRLLIWQYRNNLFSAEKSEIPYPECPNLFPSNDKWVLVLSPYGRTIFYIGRIEPKNMGFIPESQGILNGSSNFYATNVYLDEPVKEQVLVAWVRGFAAGLGWNGCLSLPRLASVKDGILRQRPHPALEILRSGMIKQIINFELNPDGLRSDPVVPQIEIYSDIEFVKQGIELLVTSATSGQELLKIVISKEELFVAGENLKFQSPLESLTFSLFIDRSVIEIFICSRYTLSTVAPIDENDFTIKFRSLGRNESVKAFRIWTLRAAHFS